MARLIERMMALERGRAWLVWHLLVEIADATRDGQDDPLRAAGNAGPVE
jgi:hypothetical protein